MSLDGPFTYRLEFLAMLCASSYMVLYLDCNDEEVRVIGVLGILGGVVIHLYRVTHLRSAGNSALPAIRPLSQAIL